MSSTGKIFLGSVVKRSKYYKELADRTFSQLTDGDFHFQPNKASNSIAIIIQHMAGNMLSRWTDFLTTDGEKEWRQRDAEFEEQNMTRQQLTDFWEKGWKCFLDTLDSLTEDDLIKTIHIRGEAMPAIDAINRQLAHYPYHVGQIVYIGRMIKDQDWQNLSIPQGRSQQFNNEMNSGKPAQPHA
jgi:hypothetical protein